MKLVRMLQKAHAAEIAAALAYAGHYASVSDEQEKDDIRTIQNEEFLHIAQIKLMLKKLDSKPSKRLDTIFTVIGKSIGYLCRVTGWLLPMKIAQLMEKIGSAAYRDIAEEAYQSGQLDMYNELLTMQRVEEQHEEYFKRKINEHPASKSHLDERD
jgi:demethoxyubiquinone hydroxylase (CLK1/Coq7/Cat5 family)